MATMIVIIKISEKLNLIIEENRLYKRESKGEILERLVGV